jgi:lipopolysaccharide export system protein LptA
MRTRKRKRKMMMSVETAPTAPPGSAVRGGARAPLRLLLVLALLLPAIPPRLHAEEQTFTFSGDSTSIVMKEGQRRTILSGNARVRSEETRITAGRIELYGEDFRYARCSGGVEVEDEERGIALSAESLLFDRQRNYLRVDGYSEMIDFENEVVTRSGFLENFGDQRRTILQIGVRILKATEETRMVCRSEYARFDRNANELFLSGVPSVRWKGDEYRATRIRINLDEEEIELEGDVEGTISTEEAGEPSPGGAEDE